MTLRRTGRAARPPTRVYGYGSTALPLLIIQRIFYYSGGTYPIAPLTRRKPYSDILSSARAAASARNGAEEVSAAQQ